MQSSPRTLESVQVGEKLPVLVEHVDVITNFLFGAAFGAAHRIHYDPVAAQNEGFTAPVIPGILMAAYATRVLVDWAGDPHCVRRVSNRNLASEVVEADLTISGEVTEIDGENGRVTCELTIASGDRPLMRTTGVVELRSRREADR